MRIDDLNDGIHLHAEKFAMQRRGIDRKRIDAGGFLVYGDRLMQHRLAVKPLVAKGRIVDTILMSRDDGAAGAQHSCKALGDLRVVFGRLAEAGDIGRDRQNGGQRRTDADQRQ